MDDEAGIAGVTRSGRTDGHVCFVGGSIKRGSQGDGFIAEAGAGVWLRWNQDRERGRALLPTLGGPGGHKGGEIAELKFNGAERRRRRRCVLWPLGVGIPRPAMEAVGL